MKLIQRYKMKTIRRKITMLLIELVLAAMLLTAGISFYTLFSMRRISVESSRELGETAAKNAEKALENLAADEELLKPGNLQDMLVQYNANNAMVSSTYIATESGWMIQADYIAGGKYEKAGLQGEERALPKTYEAKERRWYQRAKECSEGQVIYTDIIRDIHEGGDCIVCACPVYAEGEIRAVAGVGSYLATVEQAVLNTTVGKSGYAFLINEKGQVIASGKKEGETAVCTEAGGDLRKSENNALAEAARKMESGERGFVRLELDGIFTISFLRRRIRWF